MFYEKKLAWGVLFRLYHWSMAISIGVLAVTGWYIHDPWTNSLIEGGGSFSMATMRYIHFVAAFVLTAAFLVRLYLFLFGNKQERILDSAPITPRNIKNLFTVIKYYTYGSDHHEPRLGHNALASLSYLITLVLLAGQLLTGFYMLYPESVTWQSWGLSLFGTQQEGRFIHYLTMWYFLIFVPIHIYIMVWNDMKSPEGLVSSIFNGYKFKHKHDSSAKA